jgi:hypothetical protein
MYAVLANVVVLLHVAFVAFVVLGGLLVLRWRRMAWLHLPAVAWGAFVELTGRVCPLTPLEHWLRLRSGGRPYQTDFLDRYILPILYPAGLTPAVQITLGCALLALNVALYVWMWRARRRPRFCRI